MELKANPDANSEGVVIEARQEIGRGPTATVIVQKEHLKIGDAIHCGEVYCKVKAMIDDQGNQVKNAPPEYSSEYSRVVWRPCSGCNFPEDVRMNEKHAVRLMNIC